jgi:cytochrome P450
VLYETMRLYPPVWFMVRQALETDCIGGHEIPANAFVLISAYTTHRHRDYWDNAEQFDPERFTPQTTRDRPVGAYIPFAYGRHLCLGQHFAMMENVLIMATMAQNYHLIPVAGHPVEPHPALTLRIKDGLMATPVARADSPRSHSAVADS